jgi:signal transduction histidine kinase
MIFLLDRQGKFKTLNPSAETIIKISARSCTGRLFSDVFPCPHPEVFMKKFTEALKIQGELCFEAEFSEGLLKVVVSPTHEGTLVICQDITLKKKWADLLRSTLDSKREFIAIIGHELKTPITALKLQTALARKLHEKSNLDQHKIDRYLERSQSDIQRLTKLVDNILDVMNLNSHELALVPEYFSLQDEFETLLPALAEELARRNIELKLEINAPVLVFWDRHRLSQVLAQLVTDLVFVGQTNEISLKVSAGGGYVYITFEKVFDHFERASHGRGLGFYLCREIITLHQGQISMKGSAEAGVSLQIALPVRPDFLVK